MKEDELHRQARELDRQARELLELMIRAFHGFREERRWKLGEELSFPQVMLLLLIAEKGSVSAGEIARDMYVTQGVITRMADRLLDKGLIERKRDPEDRRVVKLTLTPRGKAMAARVERKRIEDLKAVLRGIPHAEREMLIAILRKIGENLEAERGTGGSRP